MTLRLVAASTDEPAQEAVDVSKKPNDSTRELPNSAKAQLRHGEAVVWWEDKKNFAWQPTAIAAGAGLAIFGLVSLIVPQLWHAPPAASHAA